MTKDEHPSRPSAPEVIAHRGACREAPENSLAAFKAAVESGADGIELDVHVTADGVPVVHHDPLVRLKSARADSVAISSLTIGEARQQTTMPTLDEVVDLVERRCRLYVEIKAAAALGPVVERLRVMGDCVAVHSFDHRIIARAASLAPGLARGVLLVSYLVDPVGAMRQAGARDLWQQGDMIDGDLVGRVHGAGGRVIAWTVDDPDQARRLVDIGIDGLCTNLPREMRRLV